MAETCRELTWAVSQTTARIDYVRIGRPAILLIGV